MACETEKWLIITGHWPLFDSSLCCKENFAIMHWAILNNGMQTITSKQLPVNNYQ